MLSLTMFIVLIVLIQWSFLGVSGAQTEMCPTPCKCPRNFTVVCSHAGLRSIPNVTLDTQELFLNDNSLGHSLNWTINRLSKLRLLDLSGNQLTRLHRRMLYGLEELKILRLSRNRLRVIPEELFDRARNVEELDLSENHLLETPSKCLKNMKKLRKLSVSRNKIKNATLGIYLQTCTSMNFLDLSHNPIKKIHSDAFDVVKEWSRSYKIGINLSFCGLQDIAPRSFSKLSRIHKLNIAGNPLLMTSKLTPLSVRLSEFKRSSLKVLNVSYMGISNISHLVGSFDNVNIKKLDISNNNLGTISEKDVQQISLLTYLNCANNSLNTLLNGISKLKYLTILDVSHNNIRTLSANFTKSVPNLKNLNLANNKITEISHSDTEYLKNLRILNLNDNLISRLQAENTLPKVEKFFIAGNQLKETDGIPKQRSLKAIDLSRNNYENLGSFIFRFCDNIAFVNLSHNNIGQINHQVFTPRVPEIIDLSYNRIKSVKYFGWLSAKEIYFRGNLIEQVDFQAFLSMNKLEILDLSLNQLSKFKFNTFKYLTHIKELYLQGNHLQLVDEYSGIFHSMKNLERLDLSNNSIPYIRGELIDHHKFMRYLSFRGNLIQVIDPEVFTPLKHLESLDVSGNPFVCSCDLIVYRNWLRDNGGRFTMAAKDECYLPLSRRGQFLTKYTLKMFECGMDMIYVVVGTTSACVFIILWFVVTIACYIYQKRKKNLDLKRSVKENFRNYDFDDVKTLEHDVTDERVFQEVQTNGNIPGTKSKKWKFDQSSLESDLKDTLKGKKKVKHEDLRKYRINGFLHDKEVWGHIPYGRRYSDLERREMNGGFARSRRIEEPRVASARQIAELYGTLTHGRKNHPAGGASYRVPTHYRRGNRMVHRFGSLPHVMERREITQHGSSKEWV